MIRQALETINSELDTFIQIRDSGISVEVKLSELVDDKGEWAFKGNGSSLDHFIIGTLVKVEEERHLKPPLRQETLPNYKTLMRNPEINVNLYILFSAYSAQYETSLKLISYIIGFFQRKQVFDKTNTPTLDENIEKIIADLTTMTFEQQNYLWGMIGAKYLPSVLYKLRMIAIDEEVVKSVGEPIKHMVIDEGEMP